MMDRRTFVLTIASSALSLPLGVRAQNAGKIYRIGFLRVGMVPLVHAFWEAMRRLGWIEHQNLLPEPRYAASEDELPALAAELVKMSVDAIVTSGTPSTWAAKNATATIPIVFIVAGDPVERRLVSSLARPGGNLTGFAYGVYDENLLEALKTMLPKIVRVALPFPAAWQNQNGPEPSFFAAARTLGLQLQPMPMQGPNDMARISTRLIPRKRNSLLGSV